MLSDEAKQKQAEYNRQWYEKNRERKNEYLRQWRKDNPDKVAAQKNRYWERKANKAENGGNE